MKNPSSTFYIPTGWQPAASKEMRNPLYLGKGESIKEFKQLQKPTGAVGSAITGAQGATADLASSADLVVDMLAKNPWLVPALTAAVRGRLQLMSNPELKGAGNKDVGFAEIYAYPESPYSEYFTPEVDPETKELYLVPSDAANELSISDPEKFDAMVDEVAAWKARKDTPEFTMKPMKQKEAEEQGYAWFPTTERYIRALSANNPNMPEYLVRKAANQIMQEEIINDLKSGSPKYSNFISGLMDETPEELAGNPYKVSNTLRKRSDVNYDAPNPWKQLAGEALMSSLYGEMSDPELRYKTSMPEKIARGSADLGEDVAAFLIPTRALGTNAIRLGAKNNIFTHGLAKGLAGAESGLLDYGIHNLKEQGMNAAFGGHEPPPIDFRDVGTAAAMGTLLSPLIDIGGSRGDNAFGLRSKMASANANKVTRRDIWDSFDALAPKHLKNVKDVNTAKGRTQAMSINPKDVTPMSRSNEAAMADFVAMPYGDIGKRVKKKYGDEAYQANRVEFAPKLSDPIPLPNPTGQQPAPFVAAITDIPAGNRSGDVMQKMANRKNSHLYPQTAGMRKDMSSGTEFKPFHPNTVDVNGKRKVRAYDETSKLFPDASDPMFMSQYMQLPYFADFGTEESRTALGELAKAAQTRMSPESKMFSGKKEVMDIPTWSRKVASLKGEALNNESAKNKNSAAMEIYRRHSEPGAVVGGKFIPFTGKDLNVARKAKETATRRGEMKLVGKQDLTARGSGDNSALNFAGRVPSVLPHLSSYTSTNLPLVTDLYGDKTESIKYKPAKKDNRK